jgi:hypothetical protein
MTTNVAVAGWRDDRFFFVGMALAMTATVFTGFAATFYLRPVTLPTLSALLVVHGTLFTCWMLTFVAQTSLIAAHRVDLHRRLGIGAAVLAPAMVAIGMAAAVDAWRRGAAPLPGIDPRSFFAIPAGAMIAFAILVGAGLLNRANSAAHKRLMLLATISILEAAIARWPLPLIHQSGPPAFFGLTDLFVVVAIGHDFLTRRRVHPAYLWGGLLIIVLQALRLLISGTPAWLAFAGWLQR